MQKLVKSKNTVVFFESPHRIKKLLDQLDGILQPDRQIMIARELTKQFESVYRGTISEVREQLKTAKGEFTIVIGP